MKTTTIMAIVTVSLGAAATGWFQLNGDPASGAMPVAAGVEGRLAALETTLDRDLQGNEERWAQLSAAQRAINDSLSRLQEQIAALNERSTALSAAAGSRESVEAEGPDEREAQSNQEPDPPSEAQVGVAMDQRLDNGGWDMEASETARSQAAAVVHKLPGVNLADMVCDERLCRATFIKLDGGRPDISDVWGHPPFLNDGFTILNEDGSVVLYYAQPGMELDDIREQLIAGS